MSLKVSIIVPSYKTSSKLLKRCQDSINSCGYDNIEVIVVSDIKGVSKARNEGLLKATGDIITFVDSDDYIEPNSITKVVEAFNKTNADIIYSGYFEINPDCRKSTLRFPGTFVDTSIFRRLIINDNEILGSVWNKYYKREVIKDIIFDEDVDYCEDMLFNMQILKNDLKIYSLDAWTYYYVHSDNSATSNSSCLFDENNNLRYFIALDKISQLYSDKSIQNEIGFKRFSLACENYNKNLDSIKRRKLKSEIIRTLKYALILKDSPSKPYYLAQAIKIFMGLK